MKIISECKNRNCTERLILTGADNNFKVCRSILFAFYDKLNVVKAFMTKGHSHHLGESTVILRGIRSDFNVLFHFFNEISLSKQNSPRWLRRVLRRHICG